MFKNAGKKQHGLSCQTCGSKCPPEIANYLLQPPHKLTTRAAPPLCGLFVISIQIS